MSDVSEIERDELELRVSDVADEVFRFRWGDLADRIPEGRTYTRPEDQGPYMAVVWEARWKNEERGPIVVTVRGYLDPGHLTPVWSTGKVIRRHRFLALLFGS